MAVAHGNAPDVEELLELIEPHFPRKDTLVADLGAVIGTHAGPRVIGLAFCVPG
jgi:fatty acid-binding protein DegV